ncbi:MAG: hypothetical protein E1N59_2886 [Puniceicoccaceae bacterium 5H]|nr:MAG: hypothetical protein E1N59_2886 [Puniceicoccaceae bacterium 5H]
MKTTLNIADDLLIEAKRFAVKRKTTLKAVVENGLRRELQADQNRSGNIEHSDFIEMGPFGLPRLKRRGQQKISSAEVYELIDKEGI